MRRCTSIFLAASIVLATVPATAQDRSNEVKELVEQGTEAFKAGRMLEAVDAFGKAAEASDDPRVGYNYARALETTGFCSRAKSKFDELAAKGTPDKKVRELAAKKVQDGLECTPMGVLAVECQTPDPSITIDGSAALCGDTKLVAPKSLKWTATAKGFESGGGTVNVTEGKTTTITVALAKPSKEPVVAKGSSGGKPWKLLAGGGAAGAGVGLFLAGLVSDATANKRSEQILDASADGDLDRLNRLEAAADTARTRSLALTISGATLATLGGVLLYLHFTDDSSEQSLTIAPSVGPSNASVTARYRW